MPNKAQSILLAGVVAGLIGVFASFIPAAGDFIACLVYIGAGMLAVWHYAENNRATLSSGQGIGLGVLTCIAAFVTGFALDLAIRLMGFKPSMREEILREIEEDGGDIAQMGAFADVLTSPLFYIGVGLLACLIAGVIGGVIGSKLFKKGEEEPVQEGGDLI